MVQVANSGYLDDLSDEQEVVMNEIWEWANSNPNVIDLGALLFDKNSILRFCRARKFQPDLIKTMLTEFA